MVFRKFEHFEGNSLLCLVIASQTTKMIIMLWYLLEGLLKT